MNKATRLRLLKAMDLLALSCNDENVIDSWLRDGIADGDAASDSELDYYTDNEVFAEVMDSFLAVMSTARESGGLYCDGVAGGEIQETEE